MALPADDASDDSDVENGDVDAVSTDALPPPDGDGTPICPACMKPLAPFADFCRDCGAPVSSLASMDPFKSIFASGYIYRKAATSRLSTFALLGMWLIFLPTIVGNCVGFSYLLDNVRRGRDVFPFVLTLLFTLLPAPILWKVTYRFIRDRRHDPR